MKNRRGLGEMERSQKTDDDLLNHMFFDLPDRLAHLKAGLEPAERILAKVYSVGNGKPNPQTDLQGLANQIWYLREKYRQWIKEDSDAQAKMRHKRLVKLSKSLEDAIQLYTTDGPWIDKNLTFGWNEKFNYIRALEENGISDEFCGLHEWLDATRLVQARLNVLIARNAESGFNKTSEHALQFYTPTRLLVAKLEQLSSRYIGIDARFSRDPSSGKVHGPFVRFSMAVCDEIGARIGPEAIAKAVLENRQKVARKRRTQ